MRPWETVVALIILSPLLITIMVMTYTFARAGYEEFIIRKHPPPAVFEMGLTRYNIEELKTLKNELGI